jgi:hypothetical protein
MLGSKTRRALLRSIMYVFVTKKHNITRLNHKDVYSRNYFFNKKLCEGIEFVAAVENCSQKCVIEMRIEEGMKIYMGDNLREFLQRERVARELNQEVERTRFILMLRRLAKQKGLNVSKIL